MRRYLRHHAISFAAALMVLAASVVSAASMAPAAADQPAVSAYLAAGGALSDLCGDPVAGDDHHCPFCRLLADSPDTAPATLPLQLSFGSGVRLLVDLTHGRQQGSRHVSARAPPALA
jgi:hypothetical protein